MSLNNYNSFIISNHIFLILILKNQKNVYKNILIGYFFYIKHICFYKLNKGVYLKNGGFKFRCNVF